MSDTEPSAVRRGDRRASADVPAPELHRRRAAVFLPAELRRQISALSYAPPSAGRELRRAAGTPSLSRLHTETLHVASRGLMGYEEGTEQDLREAAGAHAVQIQSHLQTLYASQARRLDPRVIEAAVGARDDARRLVANLARVAQDHRGGPVAGELVSLATLERAQCLLAGANDGPAHECSRLPLSDRARIEELLQQLSSDAVVAIDPRALLAAVRARGDAALLLRNLGDAVARR